MSSQITANSGAGGCGATRTWNVNSLTLTTGAGGLYSHASEVGISCGGGSVSADEQLDDGAQFTRFEWNHPTGTYNISVVWTIAARLTINNSNCGGAARGAVALKVDVIDEATGSSVWSSPATDSIFNTTGSGCSSYSHTYASTQYNFTVSGGIPLSRGIFYDPKSWVHVWTYATTRLASADVMLDLQTSNGQQNGVTLDSVNVW